MRAQHLVVLGRGRERAVRVAAHHEAADARAVDDAVDLGERAVDAAVRDQREAAEARGRVLDVLGEPVVVRAHHRLVVLDVVVGDDRVAEAGRRVEHLGVDAVAVHLLEPRRGIVAAAPDVLEAHPAPHLLGLEPGARVHPERDRVGDAFEHPRVALLEALDARRPVAVLRRHPVDPEVGRLVDVAVGRDEPVRLTGALGHELQPTGASTRRTT